MDRVGPLHLCIHNCKSKNTVFDGWLVESTDGKLRDKEDWLFIEKNLHISRPLEFKSMLFKGQPYYYNGSIIIVSVYCP